MFVFNILDSNEADQLCYFLSDRECIRILNIFQQIDADKVMDEDKIDGKQ